MKRVLIGLIMTMVSLPLMAQTAPSRVAVINVQKVLQESESGKVVLGRLESFRTDRANRLKGMETELRDLEAKFSPSLSDERKQSLQQEIADKRIAIQRFAQDAERELGAERDRALAALESRILPIISEVGKEMGFAAIFNKFESGLVYASEAIDVTDVIIKRFNEKTAESGN